ncbi:MAG: hypothetical protein V3V14_10115 [Saprospiraceae bacterium]
MKSNNIRQIVFSIAIILSISSSIYLNTQAKNLELQGYTTSSTFFEEDYETILPDFKIVDRIIGSIKKAFVF